jgi:hypothetical protein
LYGDEQRFEIVGHPGAGVRVALTLPFRQVADEGEDEDAPAAAGGREEKPR